MPGNLLLAAADKLETGRSYPHTEWDQALAEWLRAEDRNFFKHGAPHLAALAVARVVLKDQETLPQ